ncbi:hypothetical protein CWI39_0846p0020 [Hamiltosporidium magnivora]|uniref:Uncharacterized protein n=1 Tax=Hamiltosporidium magnivora TaxID=148818 RepID=A0A4Q9L8W4_9MICR|nr:hypothetical protein CWI39_0846p0020 [Hamiltosporidium magnivora]
MPKQDLQVFKYLKYIKVLKILSLENILICDKEPSENCHSEKFLPNFDFVNQKANTKIFLKNLEITAYFLNNTRIEYYMSFFSSIYDFSKLNSISLNVHKLTDIDYEFFYQIKN